MGFVNLIQIRYIPPTSPPEQDTINAVSYDNVIFSSEEPETAAVGNWFKTEEGGEAGVTDTTKIVMQDGFLQVLKEPDENTDFLNE